MSNNLCDTGIKERICQIFSVEKNLNSETKDFGFRNNLTLDYLIDKLPIQENADNIRDTILKDYLFCKTGSVSGNVVNNLIEVLASQNPVNYNNEMQDSIVINPNILIAANNYLDIIKNEKVIKIIEKANQKEHLKTVIFLDEIYSRLDDEFAEKFIEESPNIEECAVLVSRYSKELSALSKSDSNLKSAYQILNKFSSDFSLKDIKQIKRIDKELINSRADYKTIIKNPKLIKKIDVVKSRAEDIKIYTSNWLNIKLKTYLEKEYKNINFNISSAKSLDAANKKTINASLQLNQIKQKYNAVGMTSTKLNQKYSKLSAQQNELKKYNKLKNGFVKNCAIIKKDRQLIEDVGLDDIADLVSLIDKEKKILKNADISETRFSDLNAAKQDYVNESKMFRESVNNEISSIRQYLNFNCNILIKKAAKYTGLSGLFVKKDQEILMRLKDEAKILNDQILLVKNEFGISDYVVEKSNELDNLVNKLIRKNKYTYSQRLKRNLDFQYAGARLLAFTYLPSKKIIGADIKTTRKTYSLSLNNKKKKLGMMALAGAALFLISPVVYFDIERSKTKAAYQQESNIESTVNYSGNQNKIKSVSRQVEIKKPQPRNIKKYVEQMHEKYELRFTEIRQRFDMADTEKKYDFAQKQLDSLKSEMKQFMGTEIYQKYKSGKV